MRRRWRNENVEFVRDDARFKLLAKEHGKAKAARIRIAEMMAEECDKLGDVQAAERLRQSNPGALTRQANASRIRQRRK